MREEYEKFLDTQKTLTLVLAPEGSTAQDMCLDLLERVGSVTPALGAAVRCTLQPRAVESYQANICTLFGTQTLLRCCYEVEHGGKKS